MQAATQHLTGLTLEHEQSRSYFLEIEVEIHKTLEQEPDPVQPRPFRPGGEGVRIGLHVVRVDHENGVNKVRSPRGVLQRWVVVEPDTLPEPHERDRPGSHCRVGWRERESH